MSSSQQIIAIGDIHGCYKTSQVLLEKLDSEYGAEPTYIFLGDYTDRGSDSKQAVEDLIKFEKEHSCVFIRGNHDQMLLDAYEKSEWDLWLANGGETTLDDYDGRPGDFDLPDAHYQFFANTKYYWETDDFFFVHAGLNPNLTIKENLEGDKEEFIWQRGHINASNTKWEKIVVFGHTPVEEPIVRDNMIGIDTGCVYDRPGMAKLTAVVLPEKKFIKQKSLDA